MTVSLAAVFIPVLFMQGILGRLLHEFSVTIITAILVSGVVSLTLTPMLCSRVFKNHQTVKHGKIYNLSERFFEKWLRIYDVTLLFSLRHRISVMVVFMALFSASIYLFVIIPKGFIPNGDTGLIFAFTQGSQDISFESLKEHQLALAKIVQEDPYVESFMSAVGAGGPNVTGNTGRIFMRLKPRSQRPGVDAVIQELRTKLSAIPGIRAFPQNLPMIRIGGQLTKSLYQYTLQDVDLKELYHWAPILEAKLKTLPGFLDVNSDLEITTPQIMVDIDRDKASSLAVTADQIENTLYNAYGSRQVSTIYTPSDQYWVIMELEPQYQLDPNALSLLYVRSTSGQLIPLNTVARLNRTVGPLSVAHLGQLPSVTISFNLQPGYSLSNAVAEVQSASREMSVPVTLNGSFQGVAQAFQSSFQGFSLLFLLAIGVIYIVLGILYESFVHPITILAGLPSAAFGALLTLRLFHMELNILGFVGLLMLLGIVKKNAIMMIDFALNAQRIEGKSAREAIYQGCLIRFRPIMMTTLAALMGTLPIAIGFGAGSEVRQPLGLAVVGGLLISQLVTLYITPVIYLYFEEILDRLAKWKEERRLSPSA
jgi:hydrophobic/amphiphilic exporter-1 (mainly G- bacteria), HAE1 family